VNSWLVLAAAVVLALPALAEDAATGGSGSGGSTEPPPDMNKPKCSAYVEVDLDGPKACVLQASRVMDALEVRPTPPDTSSLYRSSQGTPRCWMTQAHVGTVCEAHMRRARVSALRMRASSRSSLVLALLQPLPVAAPRPCWQRILRLSRPANVCTSGRLTPSLTGPLCLSPRARMESLPVRGRVLDK
jgi:hypothetical protein